MDMIELGQLDQHNFDLDVRSRDDCTPEMLMSAYHELLTGEPLTDEHVDRFEKVLSGLIGSNAAHVGLLNEMNFTAVEPLDAATILDKGPIPTDEVMDMIANIRAQFDEAAETYAQSLEEVDLVAPVDPNPTDEAVREAKLRLARYVVAAILTDDREENELS